MKYTLVQNNKAKWQFTCSLHEKYLWWSKSCMSTITIKHTMCIKSRKKSDEAKVHNETKYYDSTATITYRECLVKITTTCSCIYMTIYSLRKLLNYERTNSFMDKHSYWKFCKSCVLLFLQSEPFDINLLYLIKIFFLRVFSIAIG